MQETHTYSGADPVESIQKINDLVLLCNRLNPRRSAFRCLVAGLFVLSLSVQPVAASPFSDRQTILAPRYTVIPGRGPFQFAHLLNISEDSEGEEALGLIFRARTALILRLKKPVRLKGFTSSIRLRVEGFRGGETIHALFLDRRGRTHRIVMGRIEQYGFQEFTVDLRGKLTFRPEKLADESYVDFTGWSVEPDLRQKERSGYILFGQPVFDVRPYDMRLDTRVERL